MTLDRFQIETMRGVLRNYWKNAGHSTEAPDALCDYALRYWWLRDKSLGQYEYPIAVSQKRVERGMQYIGPLCLEDLDKEIDAAMRSTPQRQPLTKGE